MLPDFTTQVANLASNLVQRASKSSQVKNCIIRVNLSRVNLVAQLISVN